MLAHPLSALAVDETQRREARWLVNGWMYLIDHPDENERWLDPWLDRLSSYATTYGMEMEIEELARILDCTLADLERRRKDRLATAAADLPDRTTPSHPGGLARPKWPGT